MGVFWSIKYGRQYAGKLTKLLLLPRLERSKINIAQILYAEDRGVPCIAAKLSLGRVGINNSASDKNDYMVFIYTTDFMDEEMIFKVEKALRRCQIKVQMSYKPDIFSVLGIYRHNRFNLRPTIYQSNWRSNDLSESTLVGDTNSSSMVKSTIESFIDSSCIENIKSGCNSNNHENTEQEQQMLQRKSVIEQPPTQKKGKIGRNLVLQALKRKENELIQRGENLDEVIKSCESGHFNTKE